jgi:omega-6 fatty acid desaturase (delta-12 desaturase)
VTLRELRARLAAFRRPSLARAIAHVTGAMLAYAILFRIAIGGGPLALRVAASLLAGLFAGNLFMIGHDACHGSYTRRPRLDRVLGRIAFLPSYHPHSLWELSHNKTHHIYTNLRGRDFVWTPASKAEYDGWSPLRRFWYRAYRTPLGIALYYPFEIWWPRHAWPRRELIDRPQARYLLDRLLVLAFFAGQVAVIAVAGAPSAVLLGLVVPWLVFGWLIGFVIYFNHTHPDVTWFADPGTWTPFRGIVEGTTRLVFPAWSAPVASAIMNHVAHHVDPRIALVALEAAQDRIEELLPGRIIVQPWSIAALLDILRRCKLYDFDARCWTDYAGCPTTLVASAGLAEPTD